MKIKLVNHTPLSVAVIAGRTAWQSFHKGGNYENPTDNISKDDFNFLKRLFNKFKHQSVAEHIKYTFEIEYENYTEKENLFLLKDEYNFYSIKENKFYYTFDLRNFYVNKDNDIVKKLIDKLPEIHKLLYNDEDFEDILSLDRDFEVLKVTNDIGHYVELLYHYKFDKDFDFHKREHDFYTFRISGISRALLQELVRHDDLLSITVKSTRYTLKELKDENPFIIQNNNILKYDLGRTLKYCVLTDNNEVNKTIVTELEFLKETINKGISNDISKYILPEAYRTECIITINKQNLDNFLYLRLSKDALWEIQELAKLIEKLLEKKDV